eukprot:1767154-Rhodomonas_salina.1
MQRCTQPRLFSNLVKAVTIKINPRRKGFRQEEKAMKTAQLYLCAAIGLASVLPALSFIAPGIGFGVTGQNINAGERMECFQGAKTAARTSLIVMVEDSQHTV